MIPIIFILFDIFTFSFTFFLLLFCLLELNSDHPLAFGLRTSDIVHIFLANSLCFDDFRINAGRGEIAVPDLDI